MSLATLPTPKGPGSPGSYTFADTLTDNYTTTAVVNSGAGTKSLRIRFYYPELDDPETPRPLVAMVAGSGWILSDVGQFAAEAQYIAEMGCIACLIETRDRPDQPLSTGDEASHNVLRRAMRAAVFDLDEALKYIFANYLEYEDSGDRIFTLDPALTHLFGQSQGGITCFQYAQHYPTRPIAGVLAAASAYGGDGLTVSGEVATDILRHQLNYTERYHRVPTCALIGGADSTIGTAYIEALRERISLMRTSIVHYDADGGHVGWESPAFDTSALVGASSLEEAVNNFIVARCASIAPTAVIRQNARQWSRNWSNMQSRFWS